MKAFGIIVLLIQIIIQVFMGLASRIINVYSWYSPKGGLLMEIAVNYFGPHHSDLLHYAQELGIRHCVCTEIGRAHV